MLLLVGLGNPGAQYARNRHNVGFMAVDAIADAHGFSPERSRFQGMVREGRLDTEKVMILKPMTFMNLSGQSVGEALRFYKLKPRDCLVMHDEIDLGPGKVRVKSGGGHAGHNGLRSLHQHIGQEYRRVRIGVGHPGHKDAVPGYVLHDFAKADAEWLDPLLSAFAGAAPLLPEGDAAFQSRVASLRQPRRPERATGRAPERTTAAPPRETPPKDAPAKPEEPARSPLEQLLDRFGRR